MTRAETRVISAAIELQRAKSDLIEAEREFHEAVTAILLLGMHLDPRIMEVSGEDPQS
jgi:hypothetical protein